MRIYEVSDTGVINSIYHSIEEFKEHEPEGILWSGRDFSQFKGGFLDEAQLSKVIINGFGGTRNRDYLKLKMANKTLEQDLATVRSDHQLEVKKREAQTSKLVQEVEELTDSRQLLIQRLDHTVLERDSNKKKVEEALKLIGGGQNVKY